MESALQSLQLQPLCLQVSAEFCCICILQLCLDILKLEIQGLIL